MRFQIRNPNFAIRNRAAPVAQMEERDASKPGSPARQPRWGGRTSRLRVQPVRYDENLTFDMSTSYLTG